MKLSHLSIQLPWQPIKQALLSLSALGLLLSSSAMAWKNDNGGFK